MLVIRILQSWSDSCCLSIIPSVISELVKERCIGQAFSIRKIPVCMLLLAQLPQRNQLCLMEFLIVSALNLRSARTETTWGPMWWDETEVWRDGVAFVSIEQKLDLIRSGWGILIVFRVIDEGSELDHCGEQRCSVLWDEGTAGLARGLQA